VITVWDGVVQKRIGFLLPIRQDIWWTVDGATQRSLMAAEITGVLVLAALPFLRQLANEEDVQRYLLQNPHTYPDTLNLLILTRLLNKSSQFEEVRHLVERVGKTCGIAKATVRKDITSILRT